MSPPRKRRRQQYSDQQISLASGNNLKHDLGPSLQPEIPDNELVKKDEHKISYSDLKNKGGSNVIDNKNHLSCSNTFISDPVASEDEDEDEDEDENKDEDEHEDEDEDEDDGEDESEDESYDEDESEDWNGDRYLAKLKNEMKEFEREKEIEVQKAYSALEAAYKLNEIIPIGLLTEGRWELYSSEYFSHYFDEAHSGKYLFSNKFHYDSEGNKQECGPGQISAELNIYPEGHLSIYPIHLPSQAAFEPVTIKSNEHQTLEIIFLGERYIKLKVELEVLMGKQRLQGTSYNPEMIEFSGIWISHEEQRKQRMQKPPPSPKESWASQFYL